MKQLFYNIITVAVMITIVVMADAHSGPRMELTWTPPFPQLEKPPQFVARVSGGDRVCVWYQLLELGDRTPYERPNWYIPLQRLSCRVADDPVERFDWNRLIDGRYAVGGWLELNGEIVAQPLDREMRIR